MPVRSGEPGTAAVLVVRVWHDAGEFRARVTTATDVENGIAQHEVAASRDDLERLIQAWMSEIEDP
jgi:hypothetical protein